MRILHVITDLSVGGAEAMLCALLSATDRSRAQPAVLSLLDGGELVGRLRDLDVPVQSAGVQPGLRAGLSLMRLRPLIGASRPDVVQTWMYHADLLGGLAAALSTKAPVVWGLHNSDLDKRRTKLSTRAVVRVNARLSHWLPRKIISCSERAAQLHTGLGYDASKFVVIPNGIDTTLYRPAAGARSEVRRVLGVPPDALLVGMVARFDPQKDYENFVRAAAAVAGRVPSAHFLLIGRGCDEHNAELGGWLDAHRPHRNRFHLLGLRGDVPRLLQALDLCVLSSAYGEAFPLAVGEAMSAGVPCVVTDVGDAAEMVGDTGRVVPPRNAVALADAMTSVLSLGEEARQALGRAARVRIEARFDLRVIAERYQALYESLSVAPASPTISRER
ncbi:MAG: glycosyltransferase [Thiohalocapsa sp.]|uniref:glycosyltransferase family 4 protein n=1 Tax=Thiohalocapsa sp. TaxID=2497641 RepID=UPI0025F5FA6A|nr:glycosyltransferase [Thiohalocapsa sp.]MCG6941965.1 glycosyltransferase [Thiohalocapsa sp.]